MMSLARHIVILLMLTGLLPATACAQLSQPATDLTIEVEDDLLRHGGVVTVYHLPVPKAEWPTGLAPSSVTTVRLSLRYAELQLRHPAEGTVRFRFRTAGAGASSDRLATQVLSIIGTNTDNSGPLLSQGFVGGRTSGGQIIRIPAPTEYAGEDDATRTAAKWGETQGYHALPTADERSARTLASLIEDHSRKPDPTSNEPAYVWRP